MYMIVLTGLDGSRTFCYCQRVRPEGSDLSLPLAICILSRHKDRLLFQQVQYTIKTISTVSVLTSYENTARPTSQDASHHARGRPSSVGHKDEGESTI